MIMLLNLNLKNVGRSTFRYVMDCVNTIQHANLQFHLLQFNVKKADNVKLIPGHTYLIKTQTFHTQDGMPVIENLCNYKSLLLHGIRMFFKLHKCIFLFLFVNV